MFRKEVMEDVFIESDETIGDDGLVGMDVIAETTLGKVKLAALAMDVLSDEDHYIQPDDLPVEEVDAIMKALMEFGATCLLAQLAKEGAELEKSMMQGVPGMEYYTP